MEVRTLAINQTTTFGQDNRAVQRYTVTFMVGTFGPFAELFTAEEFTPDQVRARQEARATMVKQIAGPS